MYWFYSYRNSQAEDSPPSAASSAAAASLPGLEL